MTRSDFLKAFAALPAASALGAGAISKPAKDSFAAFEPTLQAPSENSIAVVWGVSGYVTGGVELAENAQMASCQFIPAGEMPLFTLDDQNLSVRLTGLKASTRYWYRTITHEVISQHFGGAARIQLGRVIEGKIYSFITPGPSAESRFCVMNDTHANWKSFALTAAALKNTKAPVVIWNGDALNCTEVKQVAVRAFLKPPIETTDYAAETPILWTNGNHDFEGMYATHLHEVMVNRLPEERAAPFQALKRNFAVRQGAIALIGLDTGEAIHDNDLRLCGLGRFSDYRKLQAAWLEAALKDPSIAEAPFAVAFCHIPLWNTGENPFGCTEPRAKGSASWIQECYELWGPILNRHGVQLVVCGHEHYHRWDEAIPNFQWKQVLGGGPELSIPTWGAKGEKYYPTLIEGFVKGAELVIRTHDTWRKRIVDERRFPARTKNET